MINLKTITVAGAVFLATMTMQAYAAPIALFNTGVDSTGTPLSHGTVGDLPL